MSTIPWWAWAIFAAVSGFAELHAPGSYLIWIAVGAAVTAVIAATWELSIPAQIAAFGVAASLSCIGGYFIYRKLDHSPKDILPLNQRDLRMIGEQGVVCASFVNGRGKVRLGDSVWLAEGPNLSEGTPIVVRSVRGTHAIVDVAKPSH